MFDAPEQTLKVRASGGKDAQVPSTRLFISFLQVIEIYKLFAFNIFYINSEAFQRVHLFLKLWRIQHRRVSEQESRGTSTDWPAVEWLTV